MDKETLSNYGWIVICVLVMAVMLALASPFGNFVADAVKSTAQGLFDVNQNALNAAGITIMEQEFDAMLNGENPNGNQNETTTVNVPGLGDVEINDKNMDLSFDADSGVVSGITPPTEEPVPELPTEMLPETIEFNYGTFEMNTTYVPGTYEEVPFTRTIISAKAPKQNVLIKYAHWEVDENDNVIGALPSNIEGLKTHFTTYVVYNEQTNETRTLNGFTSKITFVYRSNSSSDDTLENAIYSAAFYNNLQKSTNNHVAKWNGKNYEPVNCDAKIAAINEFTITTTETRMGTVQVTAPSANVSYVLVPAGNLKAETGMTWKQWLSSEYNSTGETAPVIKTADFEDVSYDDVIVTGKTYGFVKATAHVNGEPGLYATGTKTMTKSWAQLLADGVIRVENGVVYTNYLGNGLNNSTDYLIGDLVLPSDGSIVAIGNYGFYNCSKLTKILLPEGIISIGDSAFAELYENEMNINIPSTVKEIGTSAFYCSYITSITIPAGVTVIKDGTFRDCVELSEVNLPEGLTTIEAGAFYNCNMTSIKLPSTIRYINGGSSDVAFNSLNQAKFNGTMEEWKQISKAWSSYTNVAPKIICNDGTITY